jgi:hypothetical protein
MSPAVHLLTGLGLLVFVVSRRLVVSIRIGSALPIVGKVARPT